MLLFDLGNTRLKWAWLDDKGMGSSTAIDHGGGIDPHALESVMTGSRPERVVCAAVASEGLVLGLADWLDSTWNITPEWACSQSEGLGLVNSYRDPNRMGVDRWLAMAAVKARCEQSFCVIDAGTAITVDQVDANGHHLGGWIAPGLNLMMQSLYGGTAGIFHENDGGVAAWGTSTAQAVAAGVHNTFRGMLDRAVVASRAVHGLQPEFWVTGGDGERVLQYLQPTATLAPDLVLEGLARWAGQPRDRC